MKKVGIGLFVAAAAGLWLGLAAGGCESDSESETSEPAAGTESGSSVAPANPTGMEEPAPPPRGNPGGPTGGPPGGNPDGTPGGESGGEPSGEPGGEPGGEPTGVGEPGEDPSPESNPSPTVAPESDPEDELFSFFVTSLEALQELSGSLDGFGGNLGGLEGADGLCQTIAESVGGGDKTWRAF